MPNVINATSTGNGGLITQGDDSGILNIQTNEITAISINASQGVEFLAGTAALPAITTTGDTNTGIFFPAADTIAFSEGGAESMRIDASGNVGIGTASPAQVLEVSNSTNGEKGVIIRNATSGTNAGSILRFYAGTDTAAILRFPAAHSSKANELYITNVGTTSPITFATQDTERMRILSSGTFIFSGASGATTAEATGTITTYANGSAPYVSHNIDGQGSGFTFNIFKRLGTTVGNIQYNGSGVTYVTSSDYRLKENVRPATNALDRVAKLKPCFFNWKESGAEELGFIAHELQEEFPHAVAGEKDAVEIYTDEEGNEQTRIKPQGIDTSFLVATLTAALQETKALIDTQAETINALTARIVALEGQ